MTADTDRTAHLIEHDPGQDPAAIARLAERLLHRPVIEVEPANAGANSLIFRVRDEGGVNYALKHYRSSDAVETRRLEKEWAALSFFHANGVRAAPTPIARAPDGRYVVMEWIDGHPVESHGPGDLDHALGVLQMIMAMSDRPGAADFDEAKDSCLSIGSIIRQIDRRLARLVDHPMLSRFLDEAFHPRYAEAKSRFPEAEWWKETPPEHRRLIPADFGFHNAVRESTGALRYIDFDYFGWDDPVKMTIDFLLHPAMSLNAQERLRVREAMANAVPQDDDFLARLDRQTELHRLRWVAVLLNIFTADRSAAYRNLPTERDNRFAAQIDKAQRLLSLCL